MKKTTSQFVEPSFGALSVALVGLAITIMGALAGRCPGADAADGVRQPPLARLSGSGGAFVEFSNDGHLLLTAGAEGARVWSADTFAPVTPPLRHAGKTWGAELSGDSKKVLTSGADHIARIWDVHTAREILTVKDTGCASLSPDGKRIVTCQCGGDEVPDRQQTKATIYDAESGKSVLVIPHNGPVAYVSFSPNGSLVLTQTLLPDGHARLWDSHTGKSIGETLDPIQGGGAMSALFTHDGTKVLTDNNVVASMFSTKDGKKLCRTEIIYSGHSIRGMQDTAGPITSIGMAPDSRHFVTGTIGRVQAWNSDNALPGGQPIVSTDNLDWMYVAAFSPDGNLLLVGGISEEDLVAGKSNAVWDWKAHRKIASLAGDKRARAGGFSPDGSKAAITFADTGDTCIWRVPPER